jgi:hypothetical protein
MPPAPCNNKTHLLRIGIQGIALITPGFGTGNYNDQLMEQLADAGDGNYAGIDTPNEARKALDQRPASAANAQAIAQ